MNVEAARNGGLRRFLRRAPWERAAIGLIGVGVFMLVQKRFDDFVAVRDLTLTIGHGQFFVLLGPSGCGKTTTLRMIAGLEMPTAGRILLDGKDVTGLRGSDRADLRAHRRRRGRRWRLARAARSAPPSAAAPTIFSTTTVPATPRRPVV